MSKTIQYAREEAIASALYKSKLLQRRGKFNGAFVELDRLSSEVGSKELSNHAVLCKRLVGLCNKLAKGLSPKYLRKADEVLQLWKDESSSAYRRLTVLTLNNWAAYHQQQSNLHSAMKYVIRALKVQPIQEHPDFLEMQARTQLNAATLHYELGRPKETVSFCHQALVTLQQEQSLREKSTSLGRKEKPKIKKMLVTIVRTCLTLGCAEKQQDSKLKAIESFTQAVNIAEGFMTSADPLVKTCREALKSANAMEEEPRQEFRPISAVSYKQHLAQITANLGSHTLSPSPPLEPQPPPQLLLPTKSEMTLPRKPDSLPTEERRYYSPEKLMRLNEMLESSSRKFVSADLYFHRKLSKRFRVDDEVKHLKQGSLLTPATTDEPHRLTELKKKRRLVKTLTERRGAEYISGRLDLLRKEATEELRRAAIRQVSRSSSVRNHKQMQSSRISSTKSFATSPVPSQRTFMIAKEGIATLMNELSTPIVEHVGRHRRRKGTRIQMPPKPDCPLAWSTAKLAS
jgi:tetratricopeptide (TPR) repeat protein